MFASITLELDDLTAMALAQFCKRVGWSEMRECAVHDDEASAITHGIRQLQDALAKEGYAPR